MLGDTLEGRAGAGIRRLLLASGCCDELRQRVHVPLMPDGRGVQAQAHASQQVDALLVQVAAGEPVLHLPPQRAVAYGEHIVEAYCGVADAGPALDGCAVLRRLEQRRRAHDALAREYAERRLLGDELRGVSVAGVWPDALNLRLVESEVGGLHGPAELPGQEPPRELMGRVREPPGLLGPP